MPITGETLKQRPLAQKPILGGWDFSSLRSWPLRGRPSGDSPLRRPHCQLLFRKSTQFVVANSLDTQCLAERVGFEPTNTVRCYTLSRRAPSTARPPLHKPSICSNRTARVRLLRPSWPQPFGPTRSRRPKSLQAILSNPLVHGFKSLRLFARINDCWHAKPLVLVGGESGIRTHEHG